MGDEREMPLSAFLAGSLLVNKDIDYLQLAKCMSSFEEQYSIDIIEDVNYKFKEIVYDDEIGFHLKKNYDERYNDEYTVGEYLYSLTNPEVRSFWGCTEMKISSTTSKCKKGFFAKIKARVFL